MATVRDLITDAYSEINVLAPGEPLSATLAALGLLRFQHQMDSWQADRLAMAVQTRTSFTVSSGTSTVTIGPSGADVTLSPTPLWLDTVCYVNPGSSPEQEVPIGQMDRDTYARLSIKELSSALPLQCFYQRSNTTALGSLFLWPQVDQDVTVVIYNPTGVGVPATLDDTVIGPPGYAEAFLYALALRLCPPTGTPVPDGLREMAAAAMQTMKRPNTVPATVSVDPALTPGTGAGYNILSDVIQSSR